MYKGGYIDMEDIDITLVLKNRIKNWLYGYADQGFRGYDDDDIINFLDDEGRCLAREIKKELSDVKVWYYSDARMSRDII